jgi:hypothetical protein
MITWHVPLLLVLPIVAFAQTRTVAVGRSHLSSGFSLRVSGTVGNHDTQVGLEVGSSGNVIGSRAPKGEEIVHTGLVVERRVIPRIPIAVTGLLGGFGLVTGFRNLRACDVAEFDCVGPGPVAYSWLISPGYALGIAGMIPAGKVSIRVEARRYWLAMPTVRNFALVDFGVAWRH